MIGMAVSVVEAGVYEATPDKRLVVPANPRGNLVKITSPGSVFQIVHPDYRFDSGVDFGDDFFFPTGSEEETIHVIALKLVEGSKKPVRDRYTIVVGGGEDDDDDKDEDDPPIPVFNFPDTYGVVRPIFDVCVTLPAKDRKLLPVIADIFRKASIELARLSAGVTDLDEQVKIIERVQLAVFKSRTKRIKSEKLDAAIMAAFDTAYDAQKLNLASDYVVALEELSVALGSIK